MDNLSIRYINMDNRVYTNEQNLLKYAQDFKGGTHRACTDFVHNFVVIGYGKKWFTHEELKSVDRRLQNEKKSS